MAKGNNNPRGRSSDASKPYDVSNSFVKRITNKVTEYLPQPTWLSRWMSPSAVPSTSDFSNHTPGVSSRLPATSRSQLNLEDSVDHQIPAKKPRTRFNSPATQNNLFRSDVYGAEDISPIAVRGEPVAVAGPSSAHPDFVASTPAVLAQPQQTSTKVNGDDCSETSESTSGCSSLVPQAQSTIRSLGGSRYGRGLPPSVNMDSLYRKRPSFSTTMFASPMRGSVRERTGISPFYSGRTMYGGSAAAAHLSSIGLLTPRQQRHRPSPVVVKPVGSSAQQQTMPLSATAKRILDALEQFSTPCTDAKRMPVVVGSKRKLETTGPQRYAELNIPSTPDLLRVKRRERLQQMTNAVRQATRLPTSSSEAPPSPVEYSLRTEDSETKKHVSVGKVKTKETVAEERLVEVKLPSAVLTMDKVPKIDIAIPPPPKTVTSQVSASGSFTFSSPTTVVAGSSAPSLPVVSKSMFTFSAPIPISETSDSAVDNKVSLRTDSDSVTSQTKTTKSVTDSTSNVDMKLVTSSLANPSKSFIDTTTKSTTLFTTPKPQATQSSFKPTPCPSTETKNDALNASKLLDTSKNNFGELVSKQSSGTWECSTCLIRNKSDAQTCCACFSEKPLPKPQPVEGPKTTTPTITTTTFSGFGDKFKNPVGSWECQACLVRNNADVSVCVSCQTAKVDSKPDNEEKPKIDTKAKTPEKPIGFGDKFKKPAGSWACEVCMVTNNADVVKCIACDTVKPGASLPKSEAKAPSFSFGIPTTSSSAANTASNTFSFGISKSDQSESTKNTPSNSLTTGFGVSSSQTTPSTPVFSFGIPKPAKTESENSAVSSSTPTGPMFQFGSNASSLPSGVSETKTVDSKPKVKRKAPDDKFKNISNTPEVNTNEASPSLFGKTELSTTVSTPSKSPKTKITFGEADKSNAEKTISNQIPNFYFGSNNKVSQPISNSFGDTKPPQTSFMFAPKQENSNSLPTNAISSGSTNIPVFNFGDTKNKTPNNVQPLASVSTPQTFPAPKANNIFTFGSSNTTEKKEISFLTPTTKESTVANNTTNANKPTFGSFGAAPNPTMTFGGSSTFASSGFGNKEPEQNPFVPQTTSNLFGVTNTTTASTAFGQTSAFPTQTMQENKPSAVFTFGAAPKEPAPAGGFVFNPVTEKRPEPAFGFTAQPTNPVGSTFGFNNTAPNAPTFNFEPKPFGAAAAATPFNNPSSAPVFGAPASQQQTTPFGNQPAPAPVFAFGAQPAQPAANPVFEFQTNQQASVAPAPAPASTFMFGSSLAPAPQVATPAAPPAFDPNVKPTFNFTQGAAPTTFSAIPTINSTGPTQTTQRKIRKAVRRATPSVRQ